MDVFTVAFFLLYLKFSSLENLDKRKNFLQDLLPAPTRVFFPGQKKSTAPDESTINAFRKRADLNRMIYLNLLFITGFKSMSKEQAAGRV